MVKLCNLLQAVKSDGSVITWDDKHYGGDSSEVKQDTFRNSKDVVKSDGSVVTWGQRDGGDNRHGEGESSK